MNDKWNDRILSFLVLAVLGAMAPWLLRASHDASHQTLSVSIPKLQLSTKEHVVGFEIHVASGRIAAVPNIPIGWNLSIDNNPSWTTEIEASSKVGAAAVAPDFFREFLFVERDKSPDVPFRMWGEIVVTEDFATERHIRMEGKDFGLK